jgi:hypothetical protein
MRHREIKGAVVFRASARPFVALGITFGLIFALLTYGSFNGGGWCLSLIGFLILVVVMVHLAMVKITFSDGQMSYRTLLRGTRSFSLSDLERAYTRRVFGPYGASRLLLLQLRNGRKISIRVPIFARTDVTKIFDLFGSKFEGPRTVGVYNDETA